MDARVLFTKEFRTKMDKPLNAFEIGKLRWEKLKELEENGKLDSITNRFDICRAIGMNEESIKTIGASWVSNLIRRKHLIEYRVWVDGKVEKRYRLGTAPSFGSHRKRAKKNKVGARIEHIWINESAKIERNDEKPKEIVKETKELKLIIEKGDLKFTFDGDFDIEFILEIAKRLTTFEKC